MKVLSFSLFLLILLSTSCQETKPIHPPSEATNLDSLFQAFHKFQQRINPIESTKSGATKYNDQVANYISTNYQQDLIENYTQFLTALEKVDTSTISEADWLSMQVMKWDCSIKKEGLTNPLVTMASPVYNLPSFELMPLIQIQSLHLYFAQLAGGQSVQPFKTVKDYENWLHRVDDYLPFLDTCMAKMKLGMETGIVLPKTLTQKVIPQLAEFIDHPVEEHLFYRPITIMSDNISTEDQQRLSTAYRQMITDKLKPKYRALKQFLVNEYLPVCRTTSGINALPNGLETYNYLIRLHTTTNMSVQEIHDLGKSEVARILLEMEKAKEEIGFQGDIKAFFEHLRTNKTQMPYTEPTQVIANFNQIKDKVNIGLTQIFDLKPKATFEVRRTETFREAAASAEYVPGSKDATRGGTFYVPIPDVSKYNVLTDEALFLHEAIPGHHYQLSLQQENKALPEFLHPESLGVFVEGWALYAESLGKELGLYEDPIQYFGMLSMEMHRAIRLVVDSGIHGLGWTREQAIQYSLDNEAESEASVIASIERYMATPGQALSYKIGQLKIRELRNRGEAALGDKFDIKDFHNQVLNTGSLPLVILEAKIDKWIEKQQ